MTNEFPENTFIPVKITEQSDQTYEGGIPKLTNKQVAYALKQFKKFLRAIARHGMAFDYDHLNGGFYVRDYRLGYRSDPKDGIAINDATKDVFEDIVCDGSIDVYDIHGLLMLPIFACERDGFKVGDPMRTQSTPY